MLQALDLFHFSDQPVSENCDLDILKFGDHLVSICENEGWTCQIAKGPELWKEAIVSAGGWLNPGFDPEKSDVDRSNSASVVIAEKSGDVVACNAMRLFVTKSLKFIMGRGDLFYGPTTTRLLNGMPLCLEDDYEDFGGSIGYSGGTFISEKHRGLRLGLMATRFVRLIAERLHRAEFHAGLIFQNRLNDPRPRNPYHFSRCRMCMPYMRIPDRHQDQPLLLVDISRQEFLSQIRRDVGQLVGKGHQTLDDLSLLAP